MKNIFTKIKNKQLNHKSKEETQYKEYFEELESELKDEVFEEENFDDYKVELENEFDDADINEMEQDYEDNQVDEVNINKIKNKTADENYSEINSIKFPSLTDYGNISSLDNLIQRNKEITSIENLKNRMDIIQHEKLPRIEKIKNKYKESKLQTLEVNNLLKSYHDNLDFQSEVIKNELAKIYQKAISDDYLERSFDLQEVELLEKEQEWLDKIQEKNKNENALLKEKLMNFERVQASELEKFIKEQEKKKIEYEEKVNERHRLIKDNYEEKSLENLEVETEKILSKGIKEEQNKEIQQLYFEKENILEEYEKKLSNEYMNISEKIKSLLLEIETEIEDKEEEWIKQLKADDDFLEKQNIRKIEEKKLALQEKDFMFKKEQLEKEWNTAFNELEKENKALKKEIQEGVLTDKEMNQFLLQQLLSKDQADKQIEVINSLKEEVSNIKKRKKSILKINRKKYLNGIAILIGSIILGVSIQGCEPVQHLLPDAYEIKEQMNIQSSSLTSSQNGNHFKLYNNVLY